jgi:hypothetical protein
MSEDIRRINQLIREAESLESNPGRTTEDVAKILELRKQMFAIPDPEPVDEEPNLLPVSPSPNELYRLLLICFISGVLYVSFSRDEVTEFKNQIRTLDTKNANLERRNEWLRRQIKKHPIADQTADPRRFEIHSNEKSIGINTQTRDQVNTSLENAKGGLFFIIFFSLSFYFSLLIYSKKGAVDRKKEKWKDMEAQRKKEEERPMFRWKKKVPS